jgi:hypothetical protein
VIPDDDNGGGTKKMSTFQQPNWACCLMLPQAEAGYQWTIIKYSAILMFKSCNFLQQGPLTWGIYT